MDEILEKMKQGDWVYGDGDPESLAVLEQRIAEKGRKRSVITYSDLARGIEFRLANVNDGIPFEIDFGPNWGLHSKIIGEFLGRISTKSYEAAGFMASALVVQKEDDGPGLPSKKFFNCVSICRNTIIFHEIFYLHPLR